ncbi:MAG: CvpA family protein [Acholeplasmatales bacterium]|nr:CvpA family protein [Acholeplasmatales bacterium]
MTYMNYNYTNIIGIIDLVIIFGFLISMFIGFKKGFLLKSISLANWIFGFIFAVAFASKFANSVLYNWFGDKLFDTIYNNILTKSSLGNATTVEEASRALSEYGIPKFIANIVCNSYDSTQIATSIATNVANIFTTVLLVIISFLILFFGTTILFLILKLLVKLLRKSKAVRVIDGIFGIVLYSALFYVILEVVFIILILLYKNSNLAGYKEFISNDVLCDRGMNISRWFFENNFFYTLFGLLF